MVIDNLYQSKDKRPQSKQQATYKQTTSDLKANNKRPTSD